MPIERDFRKLPPPTQAELRRVAVNMVRSGKSRIEVAEAIGVNRRFVGAWVRAFEASGEAAFAGGRRGRRPGEQKALRPRQEALIRRLVVSKCPDQLKLPFALWTREAVAELIAHRTGIRLSLSAISLYLYLAAWGFTAQKPIRRAAERDEAAMKAGLRSHMQGLQRRPAEVRSFFQAPDVRYAASL